MADPVSASHTFWNAEAPPARRAAALVERDDTILPPDTRPARETLTPTGSAAE